MIVNFIRTLTFLLVLAFIGMLAWVNVVLTSDVRTAQQRYDATRAQLDQTRQKQREAETHLANLTTSGDAVEQEARRSLRLVKPGEHFFLIRTEAASQRP